MCLDAEGALWIAAVIADSFVRVAEGGTVTHRIAVGDGRHAIACVLGGADRRTLLMCTAGTLGEGEASRQAMSGRIEAVEVEVPGAGWP